MILFLAVCRSKQQGNQVPESQTTTSHLYIWVCLQDTFCYREANTKFKGLHSTQTGRWKSATVAASTYTLHLLDSQQTEHSKLRWFSYNHQLCATFSPTQATRYRRMKQINEVTPVLKKLTYTTDRTFTIFTATF